MIDHDHNPLPRLSTRRTQGAAAFGRRAGAAQRPAELAAPGARQGVRVGNQSQPSGPATPRPLVVRYNRGVAFVGASIVVVAWHFVQAATTWSLDGFVHTAGAGSAPREFLIAAAIAALVGFAWIYQGLMRGAALTIDASGIRGFTLLGTRHFAWSDIASIETNWHGKYKRQLIVHAVFGSKTGGYGIVSPTQIPVMTAKIDRSVTEIMAAVRQYRPDIRFDRNESPTMILIVETLQRFTKKFSRDLD